MKLIIIGARAMGREACTYAQEAGFSVKGFLDSKGDALSGFCGYPPILAPVEDYPIVSGDVFVCALGDPDDRQHYVNVIAAKGGRLVSIVHPTAYVGSNVKIGSGSIIGPNATITNDTVLGEHTIVNIGATISHDNRIGSFSTLCPGCHLAGRVTIGKKVFVGTGASLVPDVSLGDAVYVAAGAVVTKSFEHGRLMGVPAVLKCGGVR